MTLTGRVPLLLLAGVAALVVRPTGSTAAWWVLAVLLLVVVDVLLAPRPALLELARRPVGSVRQGESTSTAGSAACCGTPGSRRRARPATGTASTSPPATRCCSAPP